MARGIIAITVDAGDELVIAASRLTSGKDQIFLGTHDGKCIRFPEEDVHVGRQAGGVRYRTQRG